jgi:DNA 3'-phosphatase
MTWQSHENRVSYRLGLVRSDKIAAFDLDQTLIWPDNGYNYRDEQFNWVPTTSPDTLISVLTNLIRDDWTVVIFTVASIQEDRTTPKYRIGDFIRHVRDRIPARYDFQPFVYMSLYAGEYLRPNRGLWDLFLQHSRLTPSPASFYCGDQAGTHSPLPMYQHSDVDYQFAQTIGVAYYTPDEILGVYEPPMIDFTNIRIIVLMANDSSQYDRYLLNLDEVLGPNPVYTYDLAYPHTVGQDLQNPGRGVILFELYGHNQLGNRFETLASRRRLSEIIPAQYHHQTVIFMFTQPVPGRVELEGPDVRRELTNYAQNLNIRPNLATDIPAGTGGAGGEPFRIIRIN